IPSAPDDHFSASAHCRGTGPGRGRVISAGGRPGIRAWIVPPASIEHLIKEAGVATPDDHFTASPHCRVIAAGFGCVERAGGRPAVRFGIVSAAGFEEFERLTNWTKSTPDDHFSASPDCRVTGSASGRVG